jgi:hypothetical protein
MDYLGAVALCNRATHTRSRPHISAHTDAHKHTHAHTPACLSTPDWWATHFAALRTHEAVRRLLLALLLPRRRRACACSAHAPRNQRDTVRCATRIQSLTRHPRHTALSVRSEPCCPRAGRRQQSARACRRWRCCQRSCRRRCLARRPLLSAARMLQLQAAAAPRRAVPHHTCAVCGRPPA